MSIFDVECTHIERLGPGQLVRLLKQLLYLEAERHRISGSAPYVPLQISVPDGGEDGRIQWEGGIKKTDFIPKRLTIFQSKAQKMSPSQCAEEIAPKNVLKPQVKDVLDAGGAYVQFCNHPYNKRLVGDRVRNMREALRAAGHSDWGTACVEFYDANWIASWINCFFPAQVDVFELNGTRLDLGIKSWWNWASHRNFQGKYVTNAKLVSLIENIREICRRDGSPPLRITGLSGLGKTRLALEAFRAMKGSNRYDDNALHQRVVYVDAASVESTKVVGLVSQLVNLRRDGILVVDNCEALLHRELAKELGYEGGRRISLVTLDFEPDERSPDWNSIQLAPDDCEGVVRGVIAESFPGMGEPEIGRIEEFAQGFASIAVLIGQQMAGGVNDIGHISDDEIIKRLVSGRREADQITVGVVTACSLFEYFEFSDDAITNHVTFMAESIAGIKPNEFFRVCKRIIERGIVQRRGGLARVCPIPLAITLAARWIEEMPRVQLAELVSNLRKWALFEPFCKQLAKLSFCKNANQLITHLIGPTGPFGSSEALLTEEGSRLFRALVEVNPQMSAEALWRVLSDKSRDEVFNIRDNVRRNLVWALRNLCWWSDTFARAARMMLSLAAAENEAWGNNATGEFLGLFHVCLPGTEADLSARLSVIKDALESPDPQRHTLGIKTLGSALMTEGFSRGGGPEAQGSRAPRRDYYPRREEAVGYWARCIGLLVNEITGPGQDAELARSQLANQMRGLLASGMVQEVEDAIRAVTEARGKCWPEALVAVRNCLDHELADLPPEWRSRIPELEKMLLPESIEERLRLYVSTPGWRHVKDETGHYLDINVPQAQALAEELGPQGDAWYDKVCMLFKGVQQKGYHFGHRLGQVTAHPEIFIKKAMECLRQVPVEQADPSVLGGFLDALSHRDLVMDSLEEMARDDALLPHIVRTTILATAQEEDLDRLVRLAQNGKLKANDLLALKYGDALGRIDAARVTDSCLLISTLGMDYAWCALEILFMYCFAREENIDKCYVALRKILMCKGLLSTGDVGQRDIHDWEGAIQMVFSHGRDEEFALHVAGEIIQACSTPDVADVGFERAVQSTLDALLRDYLEQVWPSVGDALLNKDWRINFHVRHMMGMQSEKDRGDCAFSRIPREFLMQWCKGNEPEAPAIVADSMPLFSSAAPEANWHPLAKSIIDEFGDIEKVRTAISMNVLSFASVGSRVPYYRRRLQLLEGLLNHSSANVRKWATGMGDVLRAEIRKEATEDEEEKFGIF